jgi:dihydroneopterin aldolase
MFTIHLHNLKFYSFHGVHEEETILGGEYEVNADVSFTSKERMISLEQTVNYVSVFEIIKEQMGKPIPLLETLAQTIAEKIQVLDTQITSIQVNIKKINPPIRSFTGNIGVSYSIHT